MKVQLKSEKLYICALSLYIWYVVICRSAYWTGVIKSIINISCKVLNFVLIAIIIVLFYKDMLQRLNRKRALILLCMLLVFLSYLNTKDNDILWTATFILFGYTTTLQKVVKAYFKNICFCLVVIIIGHFTGLSKDIVVSFPYGSGHSWGFGHPNNLAAIVLNIVLLWAFIMHLNGKMKRYYVFAPLIALIVWFVTYSRTATILIVVSWAIMLLYELMSKTKVEGFLKLLQVMIVVLFGVSIYLMMNHSDLSSSNLLDDHTFIYRYASAYTLFKQYGIHLFGNHIEFVNTLLALQTGVQAVTLDSGFMNLLLNHGIVVSTLFLLGYTNLYRNLAKRKEYIMMIIVTVFLISGLTEKTMYMLKYNFTLALILCQTTDLD